MGDSIHNQGQSHGFPKGPIPSSPKRWFAKPTIRTVHHSALPKMPNRAIGSPGPNTAAMGTSYISDPANWPEIDPCLVDQPTRPATEEDGRLVREAASAYKPDLDDFLRRHQGKSVVDRLKAFLTAPAVNFATGKAHFTNHPDIQRKLADAEQQGKPVRVVTPAFAKIGAWTKLMNAHYPTAAEEIALRHLAKLGRMATAFYPPGIEFVGLSDSTLYNPYLGNSAPVVVRYGHGLREIIEWNGLAPFVQVVNYHHVLGDRSQEFDRLYNEAHQLFCENPSAFFAEGEQEPVFRSLHASLCLKHLPMTYHDYKAVYGTRPDPSNPFYAESIELAERALACKMAIRTACRALEAGVFRDHFPGALRGTIHKVREQSRPVIGQRIYPSYYRDSLLLPYHGTIYLRRDGAHVRAKVYPEIRLRANPKLVRVTHRDGETYFYTPADPDYPADAQGLPINS